MLTKTIPSYLYLQYSDDDDLQGFVAAFNEMAQEYVDWFNQIGLPVYTGAPIAGTLLDWVAEGLYGLVRPSLPSGRNMDVGPFNTYTFNKIAFNTFRMIGPTNVYALTDDIYKRILTWHFFKGDGKVFTIRWLKRRIARFLNGANGVNFNVDQTYQISVTFGTGNQVNIRILNGLRTVTGGAIYNRFTFNSVCLNSLKSTFVSYPGLTYAPILKSAIDAGVLELPFQFTYNVSV